MGIRAHRVIRRLILGSRLAGALVPWYSVVGLLLPFLGLAPALALVFSRGELLRLASFTLAAVFNLLSSFIAVAFAGPVTVTVTVTIAVALVPVSPPVVVVAVLVASPVAAGSIAITFSFLIPGSVSIL
jgi:hypothetical protein